ncbi:MAG: tetratricopeptide repeat protein [Pseudomonadota bacterium]
MAEQRDFFISFTHDDLEIATALNEALRGAGHTTYFHPADKPLGAGIAGWMADALNASRRMIAVCSPIYFDPGKGFSASERYSIFMEDPTNASALLLLVRVADFQIPRPFNQNEYVDVVGMDGAAAGAHLVARLTQENDRVLAAEADRIRNAQRTPDIFNVRTGATKYFTGREEDLVAVHEHLTKGETTAVTAVQGMGGVGKSTLALEYARRYGKWPRYGGVWWIDAEQPTQIEASLGDLARRVGVEEGASPRETAERARDWLRARPDAAPWLVIFDNAGEVAEVEDYLPSGGSARVLITTRNAGFEDIGAALPLDLWERETTKQFFRDRIGRGTDAEHEALAETIGDLPLAAEHAAAFLARRGTPFAVYQDRLLELMKQRPKQMTGGYPDAIYASIEASLDAVREREEGEAAFAILNICAFMAPEGVEWRLLTETAAIDGLLPDPPRAALVDEVAREEALASLRDYSLAKVEEDPEWGPLLRLHRLVRDVARDRLDDADREKWAGAAVGMVDNSFPNESHATPAIWPLCARLTPHAQALASLILLNVEIAKRHDRLLNEAGLYLGARGDRMGATRMLRRSVEIKRFARRNEPVSFATALDNLAGQLKGDESAWDEAEALYLEALDVKERELDAEHPLIAVTLSNFGGLHRLRKDFAEAERCTLRARAINLAVHGETSAEYATSVSNLGAIYHDWANETGDEALRGKEEEAKTRALHLIRETRGPRHPHTAHCYDNLAVMHAVRGNITDAAEFMALALAIDLSLDLLMAGGTRRRFDHLLGFLRMAGIADVAERLNNGEFSDIFQIVEEVEMEQRAWVAEDMENRKFGPASPITGARVNGMSVNDPQLIAQRMEAAGVDVADLQRRVEAGEITPRDAASIAAEAFARSDGDDAS